jgi:hypothetical protein
VKTRHVLLAAALLVALALGGGAWWLYRSLDGLVKTAIETFGPEITGVTVRVAAVQLEPAEGKGTIRGLRVGNPKGFDAPNALTLGELRLALDAATLTGDVVRIREVVLQSPEITYQRGGGSDNLSVIQKNVEAYVARFSGPKKSAEAPGRRLIIDHLYIRDGKVSFGTGPSLALPSLHLRDIGKKSGGASPGEVVSQVWGATVRSATSLASSTGRAIKEGASSVIEGAKKLFR